MTAPVRVCDFVGGGDGCTTITGDAELPFQAELRPCPKCKLPGGMMNCAVCHAEYLAAPYVPRLPAAQLRVQQVQFVFELAKR